VRRLGLLSFAAIAYTLAVASPAAAETITCGEVVDHSIVVDNDLSNCNSVSGFALSIPGAGEGDNVTIDLNGHTIDGTGGGSTNTGILANGANAQIKNGTVKEFSTGVQLAGGAGKLKFVRLISDNGGLRISADGATAKGNTIRNWSAGGIIVSDTGAKLTENGLANGTGPGIDLQSGASGTQVLANEISGSSTDDGIRLNGADSSTISGNRSCDNGDNGVRLDSDSDSNVVSGNIACANGASGIAVTGSTSSQNQFIGNQADLNATVGILVQDADRTKVFENLANHNASDGIFTDTTNGPTKLRDNRADYNGEYGIRAINAFTNLGGNTAKHNVLGPCFGFTC
jgi:parallel beta-helix repeat protein